jgi:transcriptional regulator with XRE-family HTH domain
MTSFGDNLKQVRTEQRLSQSELADIIKMHSTHISRYERNQANPTVDVVRKIAEALKVSADRLIYGDTNQMANDSIQDRDLVRMFSKVQNLASDEVSCVKSLLDAYLMKSELKNKFLTT